MSNDVYQIITDRMLSLLESGTVPWQKPWSASGSEGLPRNFVSKKPYRGINPFILLCAGYSCPYWVSYRQAADLGGTVRKGEKGYPVVFWKRLPKTDKATGKPVLNGKGKPEMVLFLRYYTVFNLEQCDGIKWEKPVAPAGKVFEPLEEAARIVASMPDAPEIRHGGARACYSPALDLVQMPHKETFTDSAHYYNVLFHEMTHATGHAKRLARKGITEIEGFGSDPYAREELVAEMGAAFLSGHAGILHNTVTNSAAYLAGWIKALKGDPKLVVIAAAQAQKAADCVLGITHEAQESEAA